MSGEHNWEAEVNLEAEIPSTPTVGFSAKFPIPEEWEDKDVGYYFRSNVTVKWYGDEGLRQNYRLYIRKEDYKAALESFKARIKLFDRESYPCSGFIFLMPVSENYYRLVFSNDYKDRPLIRQVNEKKIIPNNAEKSDTLVLPYARVAFEGPALALSARINKGEKFLLGKDYYISKMPDGKIKVSAVYKEIKVSRQVVIREFPEGEDV